MRENLLEATRNAIGLGRNPTLEELREDFETPYIHRIEEAKDPPRIAKFRKIVKTKSHGRVDGTPVDLFSAGAVVNVYDALSKPSNRAKYAKMDPMEMISVAYKLVQKGRAKATSRETSQAGESKIPPQFLSKQGKKKGKGRAKSRGQTEAVKTYDWLKLGPAKAMASDLKKEIKKSGLLNIKVKLKDKGRKYPTTGILTVDSGSSSMSDIMKLNNILKAVKVRHKGAFTKASETSQAGAGVKNAMAQAVQGRGAPRKPLGDVGYSGTVEQAKGVRLYVSPDGKGVDVAVPEAWPKAKRAKVWSLLKKFNVRKISDVAGAISGAKLAVVKKALGSMAEVTEQGKLKMFRKASGNQPDIYQVLNPSGGAEGFIEKQPDKGGMKYPWKAFGRTYGGKPGRGKHIGDFPNKNRAMKAVMKGKAKREIAPVIGALARAAGTAAAGAIAQKVTGK